MITEALERRSFRRNALSLAACSLCMAIILHLRAPRVALECGGKRSAIPLWLAAVRLTVQAKAPSPLRSAGALRNGFVTTLWQETSRVLFCVALLSLAMLVLSAFGQAPASATRFQAMDVFVDSGAQPLAAYQIEITAPKGLVKIAGIEGGEDAAFREPPFYDPKAIQHERVILAAFSTSAADKLPKGRTRVATIHVQLAGEERPQFTVKLHTAATVDGKKIAADAAVEERKSK